MAAHASVTVRGDKLDAPELDGLFAQVASFAHIEGKRRRRCEVDLSGLQFASPAGLTGIVLAARELSVRGWRPTIIYPNRLDTARYLNRMGLKGAVRPFGRCTGAPRARSGVGRATDALLEITPIERGEDIDGLMEHIDHQVRTILTSQLGYTNEDVGNFANVISELSRNIVDHSEAAGYVAAQRYKGRHGKFVLLSVGDHGIGLRQSLQQRFDTSSWTDDRVILNALRPEYSRHPNRGLGLTFVRQVCLNYRGSLHVRSGASRVYIRAGRAQGVLGETFPGTQVSISLLQRA